MKENKRFYMVTLVVITAFTVLSIVGMLPPNQSFIPSSTLIGLSPLLESGDKSTDVPWSTYLLDNNTIEPVIDAIDPITLEHFIEVYVKEIKDRPGVKELDPLDKKEVRLILEDMGLNNTTRLKEILSQEINEDVIEEVAEILEENLFERDIQRLDIILGIE